MSILNRKLLMGTALAGLIGALPVAAQPMESEEDLRAMMRAWILDEPEILIEAMQVLEVRQREEASTRASSVIIENRDALMDLSTPGFGAADAAVTIVKFSDYQCGYCQIMHGTLDEIVAQNPDVRVLIREYPILGEASQQSARLGLAAWRLGGEEAYALVHDMLFEASGDLSAAMLTDIVAETGLDLTTLDNEMRSPEVTAILEQNMMMARLLEVQGTPALIIGDRFFGGVMDAEALSLAIAEERP